MNSSVDRLLRCGSPSCSRCAAERARSKRPLLAITMRSVVSRNVGLDGLRNDPHAHDPLDPLLFCHTISPRSSRPSSSKMRATSPDRLR